MHGSAEAIRALVEPVLLSSGLELWDVEVSRDTVRILVDRPGGIDLDALAGADRELVSPLLDEHPEVTPEGQFHLEVSSPGLERTLRRPDQYQRYIGTEISVKTTETVAGARRHHGTLVAADEAGILLAPGDAPADAAIEISHRVIERARTVLVWGPTPAPGTPSKKAKAAKRPAADARVPADQPVASNHTKDTGS